VFFAELVPLKANNASGAAETSAGRIRRLLTTRAGWLMIDQV
jgi:hypothetical protein